VNLKQEYDLLFPNFDRVEGHARLTERTCRVIQDIFNIIHPMSVFEIGFNAGHSAYAWMRMFGDINYHSVDICQHAHTQRHADVLKDTFGSRFKFTAQDSKTMRPEEIANRYDLAFIDGDHSFEGLRSDYELCGKAEVKWLLIDDYSLRPYITDFLNHIDRSPNHKYEMVKVYTYDSQWDGDAPEEVMTSQMALFRRTY
jgi:hypothetical protein